MSDTSRKALFCSVAVVAALGFVALVWRTVSPSAPSARADAVVRDVPASNQQASAPQARSRVLPLASIPWKRDNDSISPISVVTAQLPWVRRVEQPTVVVLLPADLPWMRPIGGSNTPNPSAVSSNSAETRSAQIEPAALPWDQQRAISIAPVFLVTADLPWRH